MTMFASGDPGGRGIAWWCRGAADLRDARSLGHADRRSRRRPQRGRAPAARLAAAAALRRAPAERDGSAHLRRPPRRPHLARQRVPGTQSARKSSPRSRVLSRWLPFLRGARLRGRHVRVLVPFHVLADAEVARAVPFSQGASVLRLCRVLRVLTLLRAESRFSAFRQMSLVLRARAQELRLAGFVLVRSAGGVSNGSRGRR
eukprot:scaffold3720_cov401-Prasinococcus_capsulatus_cf.AAC.12